MDSLTIHGLTLRVRVGCTARERARPQRLSADIRLETSLRRAGERDDLRFTVDYAALAGRLRTAVEKNSYVLVEAVAEELARAALAAAGARTVSVRVRKKVLAGIDDVEVEINRSA